MEHPPKDERNIKSWLVFKAIHRSLGVLRKRRMEIEVREGSAYEIEARPNEGNEEELEEAPNLISALPKRCKSVIVLFYMDERTLRLYRNPWPLAKARPRKGLSAEEKY